MKPISHKSLNAYVRPGKNMFIRNIDGWAETCRMRGCSYRGDGTCDEVWNCVYAAPLIYLNPLLKLVELDETNQHI